MIFEYSSQQLPIGPASEKLGPKLREYKDLAVAGVGYLTPESFVKLTSDTDGLEKILIAANSLRTETLRTIFVVGIGGSSLGVRAVVDALPHLSGPKIIILDTIDHEKHNYVRALAATFESAGDFAVVLISKSGETTESIANFVSLKDILQSFENWESRVVVVTNDESRLMLLANESGYQSLAIPPQVGGRYSVFSAVGVLPLLLAGYPVEDMFEGAQEALALIGTPDDPTLRFCEDVDRGQNAGMRTLDFFFFDPRFESLGKWTRQLWGESLGKSTDREGRPVHKGILPTVSIGTEDLHSMLQFYFGGPRDRMTVFVPPSISLGAKVSEHPFNALIPGLEGRDMKEVLDAIYVGVRSAYREHGLAAMEVKPSDFGAKFIGAFMQWQMCAVAALGDSWDVNAFDQPNVEDYKKVTREILAKGMGENTNI
jgi:glucose-6-phosphate isomerase